MNVSKNRGVLPPNHPLKNRGFHYKPSILGYPYFWKHPNQLNQFFFHSSRLENCRKSTLFPLSATLSFLTNSSNFVLCNPRGVFWPQYQNLKTSFMYIVVMTLKVERHIILSFWSIISESKLISVLLLLLDFFFKQKRIPQSFQPQKHRETWQPYVAPIGFRPTMTGRCKKLGKRVVP